MVKKVVKNEYNTIIPCVTESRTARMIFDNVCIGTITEVRNDAGEFSWIIKPDYAMIEKHPITITGIDLTLELPEYIRTGIIPEFVRRRTMPDNRENLREELERVGLTENDRFEFMVRTHGNCGGSRITVEL